MSWFLTTFDTAKLTEVFVNLFFGNSSVFSHFFDVHPYLINLKVIYLSLNEIEDLDLCCSFLAFTIYWLNIANAKTLGPKRKNVTEATNLQKL